MQTIGERLEEARKKKGISIREAAEATKIRGDYLQKFESNHFDIGLTEIYTRGFLRTYSNFLKVPADRIINDYAALGRGDVRPRQPNREVYGRMDISVATDEGGERAAAPAETVAAPEPSHANRGPTRPRTGSSLPTGPDPAVVFKYAKWAAVGVIVLLVLLILKSLFSGPKKSSGSNAPATNVAPAAPSLTLIAVRSVQVRVCKVNPDKTDGDVLFSKMLAIGESVSIPRPAGTPIFVEGTPPENLDLEVNGKHGNLAAWLAQFGPGYSKAELPAP